MLSKEKIKVENIFVKVKTFKMFSTTYRNRCKRFELQMNLIAGIIISFAGNLLNIEQDTKSRLLKHCFYKDTNLAGKNEISYPTKSKSQNVSPIALNIDLRLEIRVDVNEWVYNKLLTVYFVF